MGVSPDAPSYMSNTFSAPSLLSSTFLQALLICLTCSFISYGNIHTQFHHLSDVCFHNLHNFNSSIYPLTLAVLQTCHKYTFCHPSVSFPEDHFFIPGILQITSALCGAPKLFLGKSQGENISGRRKKASLKPSALETRRELVYTFPH